MKISFLLSFFLFFIGYGIAQPGSNDSTFNTTDLGFGNGDGFNNTVFSTAVQSDDKVIVGGTFTSFNGSSINRIARLNEDGSLDTTFNPGIGFNNSVRTIVLQLDGKMIIGGDFTSYNGSVFNRLTRLNSDGSIDVSFNIGAGFNGQIFSATIQSDGKIIVAGGYTSFNGITRNRIVRLNQDGSLDYTFDPGSGFNWTTRSISIQTDNKTVIGGDFTNFNGITCNRLVRLNIDGSFDSSFNTGTGFNGTINSASIQLDGKVITGGAFTLFNGTSCNNIVRLNEDGSLDASFDSGYGFNGTVNSISILADTNIIVGGEFYLYDSLSVKFLVKLNNIGSVEPSFNTTIGANNFVHSISFQSNGEIIIGGNFNYFGTIQRTYLTRLNIDGTLDLSFNSGTGFNSLVIATTIQSDGKVLVGGGFTSYNGIPVNYIVRLNSDGSLDPSFYINTGFNGWVNSISIQSDNKIIVGGAFSTFDGIVRLRIARLNADGSLDATFDAGQGLTMSVLTTIIQPDGKILIGGGYAYNYISRLNSDGSNDLSFNVGSGFNSLVRSMSLKADGKIIVAGNFTTFNGVARNRIACLNEDGSLDITFDPGTGFNNSVWTIFVQTDDKILAGGQFTSFNGNSANYISRLNGDGSLDTTFNFGTGFNNIVVSTYVKENGRILIGGAFTSYNGMPMNYFVSMNFDGSLDTILDIGSGFSSTVQAISMQEDGKILVSGEFNAYNGVGRNRIARLHGHCQTNTGIDTITSCNPYTWINGVTYTSSNDTDSFYSISASGCDTIVHINLTIIPSIPILTNTFSMPSDANNCLGALSITTTGNADFNLNIDSGGLIMNTSNYSLITNLCPGVHSLLITDNCGVTLSTSFVVPIDSNYVYNNPYIDSLALDSLGSTINNCQIYYNSIDTAFIDSVFTNGNIVTVIWNIIDSNGSNFDTSIYVLNNGPGIYLLQLNIFCPTKSIGDYFSVTEAYYFHEGTAYIENLKVDSKYFIVYPNPTQGELTLNFKGDNGFLKIMDINGRIVSKSKVFSDEKIKLIYEENGIYFLELTTTEGEFIQRIILVR